MEHSWIGNSFMDAISNKIYQNPMQIAWVGDYADTFEWESPDNPDPKKLHLETWGEQRKEEVIENLKFDYTDKVLVNHTKKSALNFNQYIKNSTDKDGWCIHPLSLLTACGNGEGGGDFGNESCDDFWLVGSWCWDTISIEDHIPEGYTLEEISFKE